MLRLSIKMLLVPMAISVFAACGVDASHRAKTGNDAQKSASLPAQTDAQKLQSTAPKFMIARVATKDLHSKQAKIDFISVSSSSAISSGADAAKAFDEGQSIEQGSSGGMSLASDSSIRFELGLPPQAGPGQYPEPYPAPYPGSAPYPAPGPQNGNCGCGFFGGILSFFGNVIGGATYYIGNVLQALNPFAYCGSIGVGYQYSNQYTNGPYQYSVYNQIPGVVNAPGQMNPGKPYPGQPQPYPGQPQPYPGQPQPYPGQVQPLPTQPTTPGPVQPLPAGPIGQEPMPTRP
jgi:hypothetical protein